MCAVLVFLGHFVAPHIWILWWNHYFVYVVVVYVVVYVVVVYVVV